MSRAYAEVFFKNVTYTGKLVGSLFPKIPYYILCILRWVNYKSVIFILYIEYAHVHIHLSNYLPIYVNLSIYIHTTDICDSYYLLGLTTQLSMYVVLYKLMHNYLNAYTTFEYIVNNIQYLTTGFSINRFSDPRSTRTLQTSTHSVVYPFLKYGILSLSKTKEAKFKLLYIYIRALIYSQSPIRLKMISNATSSI